MGFRREAIFEAEEANQAPGARDKKSQLSDTFQIGGGRLKAPQRDAVAEEQRPVADEDRLAGGACFHAKTWKFFATKERRRLHVPILGGASDRIGHRMLRIALGAGGKRDQLLLGDRTVGQERTQNRRPFEDGAARAEHRRVDAGRKIEGVTIGVEDPTEHAPKARVGERSFRKNNKRIWQKCRRPGAGGQDRIPLIGSPGKCRKCGDEGGERCRVGGAIDKRGEARGELGGRFVFGGVEKLGVGRERVDGEIEGAFRALGTSGERRDNGPLIAEGADGNDPSCFRKEMNGPFAVDDMTIGRDGISSGNTNDIAPKHASTDRLKAVAKGTDAVSRVGDEGGDQIADGDRKEDRRGQGDRRGAARISPQRLNNGPGKRHQQRHPGKRPERGPRRFAIGHEEHKEQHGAETDGAKRQRSDGETQKRKEKREERGEHGEGG
jgi:hypothetical protein